uniref:Uncharacterized protein n=1 Tax=Romanomermis culicivorax TaxID=13658 RepID=A0A915IQ52_ROMCU
MHKKHPKTIFEKVQGGVLSDFSAQEGMPRVSAQKNCFATQQPSEFSINGLFGTCLLCARIDNDKGLKMQEILALRAESMNTTFPIRIFDPNADDSSSNKHYERFGLIFLKWKTMVLSKPEFNCQCNVQSCMRFKSFCEAS